MVSSLSGFFRTTLSKGRDYISVQEEEAHIRSYLEIQQFRYRDILEYEIRIPEEMYSYQILKLTLQPLVENALYHGIKNKRGLGHILVTGEQREETMIFRVRDDGMGMDEERLKDVDLCLKLRKAGYLNVFTPFAELYHFESLSRGLDDKGEKAQRYERESEQFRERWKDLLEAGDPYYNPNFSLDRSDFALKI